MKRFFGRLVPQSLFGRLMVVLLAGLMLAQLLSVALNLQERDRLLFQASGVQSAQRIADTVLLLDSLDHAERRRVVAILNVPPQVVKLESEPPPKFADGADDTAFAAILHAALGGDRQLHVTESGAIALPPMQGPGSGYGRRRAMAEGREFVPGMYRYSHDKPVSEVVTYRTQLQLKGGQWITFDTQIPREAMALPWRLLATLALLFVAVAVLSYAAVHWVTRPLRLLASQADALGRDLKKPPMPETGPTEVRLAARAFNAMQASLRRLIEDRTRIFTAMSHDLKTPITRLRLRAEMLEDDEQGRRFEKDLVEMESMVGQTLDFVRGFDSGEARRPVDVKGVLEALQDDLAELGYKVTLDATCQALLLADAALLKRCIGNVLENAVKYGQEARVEMLDTADKLIVRIRDQGPGIPENELERVFEPFRRLDPSRSRESGGTGLGLTIARSIAETLGGNIELHNRPEGGLEAVLDFPHVVAGQTRFKRR